MSAQFWSDGAVKDRWIGLPNGSSIVVQSDKDWDFPAGTVLRKDFRLSGRLVETRLLMRHPDGNWGGFTYEWNAGQTDATLLQGGATRTIDSQQWVFPSEGQCLECHTSAAGRTLGPTTAQLNRSFVYPQTGRSANQLYTLNHIGVLSPPITDPAAQPTMPDPSNISAPLANRARAWLDTNCSQCHRPNGPTPSTMDLRYTTALSATNACNAQPQSGDLGLGVNARLIAPGSATNSIVVNRANRRDANGCRRLVRRVSTPPACRCSHRGSIRSAVAEARPQPLEAMARCELQRAFGREGVIGAGQVDLRHALATQGLLPVRGRCAQVPELLGRQVALAHQDQHRAQNFCSPCRMRSMNEPRCAPAAPAARDVHSLRRKSASDAVTCNLPVNAFTQKDRCNKRCP